MWALVGKDQLVNLDFVDSITCSNCGGLLTIGDNDIYFTEPNATRKIERAIANGFRVIHLDGTGDEDA